MLCQLSYAGWSVRVCDISEQNLVPSNSGECDACDFTLSVYTPGKLEKYA
jgi:hypothetical protein